jgi:uncharacterized protein YodC (DUF2158 family)
LFFFFRFDRLFEIRKHYAYKEFKMSVRATESLIADVVSVSAIPGSPKMVVLSVNADAKQVTTVWFSSSGETQQAIFPASALDRVEVKAPATKKPAAAAPKGGAKPGKKK